jgi:hypothetical protein
MDSRIRDIIRAYLAQGVDVMGPKLTAWAFAIMVAAGLLTASHMYAWKRGYTHGIYETTEMLRVR